MVKRASYNDWRKNKRKNDARYRMSQIKDAAKRRKISIENNKIRLDIMINLLHEDCYYCGKSKAWGLDRINSKNGYFLNNVLPSCHGCNVSRHTQYSVEEFKVMIKALLKFRKKLKNR